MTYTWLSPRDTFGEWWCLQMRKYCSETSLAVAFGKSTQINAGLAEERSVTHQYRMERSVTWHDSCSPEHARTHTHTRTHNTMSECLHKLISEGRPPSPERGLVWVNTWKRRNKKIATMTVTVDEGSGEIHMQKNKVEQVATLCLYSVSLHSQTSARIHAHAHVMPACLCHTALQNKTLNENIAFHALEIHENTVENGLKCCVCFC